MKSLLYYTLHFVSKNDNKRNFRMNFETPDGIKRFLEGRVETGRWKLYGSTIISRDTPGVCYAVDYHLKIGRRRYTAEARAALFTVTDRF